MAQWQLIETAPKDREILGCHFTDYGSLGVTRFGPWTMKWKQPGWVPSWDGDRVIECQTDSGTEYMTLPLTPTHWQELPELPQKGTP